MRQTIIIHSGLAWREARKQAAENRQHGLQVMTIEALSARLAGGFLQPISADDLKQSIRGALDSDLGELDEIKLLPGFPRAAAQSLSRAWNAGIDFDRCSASASVESALRISAIQKLEAAALRHLNPSLLRPSDLVAAALKRIGNAAKLFGAIEIQGRTEMSPVWRPLITALSSETKVTWASGPRFVPGWVRTHGIALITSPTQNPAISKVSCASPKHEVLEALRWVRELIASGKARPQDIGIAAASPEEWDDHFIALSDMAGLDVHFVHGRKALTTPEGQLAASLAEVLLRGPSQTRVARLVSLIRTQNSAYLVIPSSWQRALPPDAPLLDYPRWRRELGALPPEYAGSLQSLFDVLTLGLSESAKIGELLLVGASRSIWRKALTEGPPEALDVTLASLRVPDAVPPEAAVIWAPASALAAVPRQVVRLIGLTSSAWPRRPSEDPLLPDHIIPSIELEPLPIHEADRRDFDTIIKTTAQQVVCSRARRDAGGRTTGISPLYATIQAPEVNLQRARVPEHAAGMADRLFARPDEFATLATSISARSCWIEWHSEQRLTPHDGLMSANHPVVLRALQRRQSATSLSRLLRDPLGYLWRYGFHWDVPSETEEPLQLEAKEFGEVLHEVLESAVTKLESARAGMFSSADDETLLEAIENAIGMVGRKWEEEKPIPPPIIWRRKLLDVRDLAYAAITYRESSLPEQRSWAEIPFGGDPSASRRMEAEATSLPWNPLATVLIPGTDVMIGGKIDRLDLSGDGTRARVTDYKSGKPPKKAITLKGGAELQRCLYAFAVKALLPRIELINGRLLYPKHRGDGLYDLANPNEALVQLTEYITEAIRLVSAGNVLPGIGATDSFNDLAFALPGGAKESYFEIKMPLVRERLTKLAPLWEME